MKNCLLTVVLFILIDIPVALCQKSNPVEYMNKIGEAHRSVTKEFLDYTSAVSHGKSARKVEKRRSELFGSLNSAKAKVKNLQPFEKTDASYRDASLEYLNLCNIILKEDYGKIVDMEEIAEQSYDNMEAYLLAQDKANEKLEEAAVRLDIAEKQFAANHNVTLLETKSELSQKAEKVGKVNNYYHIIYLVFFKSYKQEAYLVTSIEEKNINSIEQNKNSLEKISSEGLSRLDTMKSFMGDASLNVSCKKMLQFCQKESKEKVPVLTDFILKNEQLEKMKKAIDSKPQAQRTKTDTDNFNKAVNEFNIAVNNYNKVNKELNDTRNKLINDWNNTATSFMDRHMPFSK
ncbi:MAG: hypothetical protein ACHQNT_12270 [Bacteroidia bacterium]